MKTLLVMTHFVFCCWIFSLIGGSEVYASAILSAIIGAVSTLGGALLQGSQAKSNQAFAEKVRQDQIAAEEERRETFTAEYAKLIDAYNELRDSRPGMTVKDFIGDIVEALDSPELREAFASASDFEFELAQDFADRATKSNLSTFKLAAEELSGGAYDEILGKRNEIALTDDAQSRVNRAIELASPALSAGSVQLGSSDNPFINRGDAKVIRVAEEEATKARNEQFAKLFSLTEADRNIAQSQQERAKEFLPQGFLDFKGLGTGIAEKSIDSRLQFQLFDEANQLTLARDFLNLGAQTTTPDFQYT